MAFIYTDRTGKINTGVTAVDSSGDGGGGSPVLLDGLVGWALTDGPQQTLSSEGVVASGPLDLTATGTVTYSGDGARLGISGVRETDYLQRANDPGLLFDDNAFFLCFIVSVHADLPLSNQVFVCGKADASDGEWDLIFDISNDGLTADAWIETWQVGGGVSHAGVFNFSLGTPYFITAWRSADGDLGCSVNLVPPVSIPTGVVALTPTAAPFFMGTIPGNDDRVLNGWMKYYRVWIGNTAQSIIDSPAIQSSLYNSGAGQTDEWIAAYTG